MISRLFARHLASFRKGCEAIDQAMTDRRRARRYLLPGSKVRIVADGLAFDLRLRDLSWRGICGLTDAPLARGQAVVVQFADGQQVEAEVLWARAAVVGAVFREPLPDDTVHKLWRRYRSRRSRRPGL